MNLWTDEEKKAFQKELKKLDKDKQERVKRFLARHEVSFGLHGSMLTEEGVSVDSWASNKEKAAFREFQMAANMSYEARVEALQSLWNALSDMKKVMGKDFNLSNLPLVISDRQVTCGAAAHYAGEMAPSLLSKEELSKVDPTKVNETHRPHIALGMGLEKSLAHEISHYLENRISLRVAEVGMKLNRAVKDSVLEVVGGSPDDDIYKIVGGLTETQANMYQKLNLVTYQRGDSKYLSSTLVNAMKLRESEEYKADPKCKEMVEKSIEKFRALPTGEELYQLLQGIKDQGVMSRLAERDKVDKEGGSVMALMAEMSGQSKDQIRDYWSNGTEIVARAIEQHVYYQSVQAKALNPTLTHMMYEDTEADGRYQYLTEDEYKALKPKIEAVLGQVQEHMLKSMYDHTKPIADKDERAYERVKQVLINLGYFEADFEPGGVLYGWSVNQLIDLAKNKRGD